jgi:hypothetical protein
VLLSTEKFSVFDSLLNPVLSEYGNESQDKEERSNNVGTCWEDIKVILLGKDFQQFEVLGSGGV